MNIKQAKKKLMKDPAFKKAYESISFQEEVSEILGIMEVQIGIRNAFDKGPLSVIDHKFYVKRLSYLFYTKLEEIIGKPDSAVEGSKNYHKDWRIRDGLRKEQRSKLSEELK